MASPTVSLVSTDKILSKRPTRAADAASASATAPEPQAIDWSADSKTQRSDIPCTNESDSRLCIGTGHTVISALTSAPPDTHVPGQTVRTIDAAMRGAEPEAVRAFRELSRPIEWGVLAALAALFGLFKSRKNDRGK